MDFDLSDEQAILRDSAERFVRENYSLQSRRARAAEGAPFDRGIWQRFAEMGWLGLPISEKFGGLGGSEIDVFVLMTALGRALSVEPIVTSSILCGSLLEGSGSPARAALLERMCAGELRLALAHLEPSERVEEALPRRTSARLDEDGWIVSGDKRLVLDGDSADAFVITASSSRDPHMMLMLIDRQASGIAVTGYPLIDGARAADVSLQEVRVPSSAVLMSGGDAKRLLEHGLARATLAYLGQALGSMEACLDICSAHLKNRVQFGQPLGKFQVLQHMMADMLLATHQARSSIYFALAAATAEGTARFRALSSAKVTVGEAAQLVSRYGVQLHGGYGIADEHEISHHYRRLLVIEKLFGDSVWHSQRLADFVL
jgi:alkylation response protein AidB-like acyl-CoA dehydrogenase